VSTFVTLDQVKAHLRINSTAEDDVVQDYADQAEEKIVTWCTTPVVTWTPTTVPKVVVAAILKQAAEFYRFRGDEPQSAPRQTGEELSVEVRELLRAYHQPGIA
jgi:uncharacterized phage protein (predicted DNA packaging)